MNNSEKWLKNYNLAKIYYEHHGNLEMPIRFKTKDGYTYDEDGIALGRWIINQRQNYKKGKLDENKQILLNKIGMLYIIKKVLYIWEEMYELAKIYYDHHGNLEIVNNFKTKDGYTFDEDGYPLGRWINCQRSSNHNNNLCKEKIALLNDIGMKFERIYFSWEEWYELAKNYYDHHGNLSISHSFKTKDGYTFDKDGFNLGNWIIVQRKNYKKNILSENKKRLLDAIEFQVDVTLSWEEWYELAKNYYDHHGNLEITGRFKTKDGYTYDDDGVNLGNWIFVQRKKEESDKNKIEMLKQIGMRYNKKRNICSWEEWYNLAKNYYEHYKNLYILHMFKTKDGYTFDEDGAKLGNWIITQRQNYKKNKISQEHIELLEQIGMVWYMKKSDLIKSICLNNNIDYNLNKDILKHISIQEFESKINYLLNNNISLINEDGRLHEIFNMSSVAIKEKYNISLEELLEINNEKNLKKK